MRLHVVGEASSKNEWIENYEAGKPPPNPRQRGTGLRMTSLQGGRFRLEKNGKSLLKNQSCNLSPASGGQGFEQGLRLEKNFTNSTAFIYQPFSNLTGMTFHREGLRHPEGIRGVFTPKQMRW